MIPLSRHFYDGGTVLKEVIFVVFLLILICEKDKSFSSDKMLKQTTHLFNLLGVTKFRTGSKRCVVSTVFSPRKKLQLFHS